MRMTTGTVMKTSVACGIGAWVTLCAVLPASAQAPRPVRTASPDKEQRYRIGTMEHVLAGAVEHGAEVTRERLQAKLPADMLLSENARVRGFRLEGYGMFFDVAVPSLEGTVLWTFKALNQNNLGLDNALRTLRSFVEASSENADAQQALRRLELQVAPISASQTLSDPGAGAPASLGVQASSQLAGQPQADPILDDPQEAYRAEVRDALMNAMLDYSRGLDLTPEEWLTVAARSDEDRPRLAPVDTDARTVVIQVRGADLNAFLAGQISRDDARKRMGVRVF